jgi:hypothetical protein
MGHLKAGQSFGPWYCDECGLGIRGVATDDGADIESVADRQLKTLVLLRLYDPLKDGEVVHIVVQGMAFAEEGEEPDFEHDVYFYNEHTCPWNYLRIPLRVGEDSDPHGVFQHQETVLMPKDYDDHEVFANGANWADVFPSLRTDKARGEA